MNKKKGVVTRLIILILIGVILFSSYNICVLMKEYHAAEKEYDDISAIARSPKIPASPQTGPNSSGSDEILDVIDENPIDFDALSEINPDIIGWIILEGTCIDYPIVQGSDNSLYLYTTFTGARNASGSIFLDYRISPDFSDKNSIIYGHRMKNGTMFEDLSNYKEQSFFEEYPSFTIYTREKTYRCEIFSAYVTSSSDRAYEYVFRSDEDYAVYLKSVSDCSLIQTGVAPTTEDRIVTLSTCDYTSADGRFVVLARLKDGQ